MMGFYLVSLARKEICWSKTTADLKQARMFGWREEAQPSPNTSVTDSRQVSVFFLTPFPLLRLDIPNMLSFQTHASDWHCGHRVCSWITARARAGVGVIVTGSPSRTGGRHFSSHAKESPVKRSECIWDGNDTTSG